MSKPVLVGMNNPLSRDPRFDLYPYPDNCTGYRLWKMLPDGTSRKAYLEGFDRRNILHTREWDRREAAIAARTIIPELDGRLVVVLGSEVRIALGLEMAEPLSMHDYENRGVAFTWLAMPHPSGRNRWFNTPVNYEASRAILTRVFVGELV